MSLDKAPKPSLDLGTRLNAMSTAQGRNDRHLDKEYWGLRVQLKKNDNNVTLKKEVKPQNKKSLKELRAVIFAMLHLRPVGLEKKTDRERDDKSCLAC